MRFRHVSVSYSFGSASQSLERHYRELRDDLLRQSHHYGLLQPSTVWRPPVDIHETETLLSIKMELAGIREDNLEVTLYDNALVVTGAREDDSDHDEPICYHEAQVHYGPFRAEVLLPLPVQHDAVTALYENGFLRVRLPKAVASEPGSWRGGESLEESSLAGSRGHLNAGSVEPAGIGLFDSPASSSGSHSTPTRRLA
jgi:HSP20 family protein